MYGTLHIERSLAVVAETTITGTVNLMENAELILSGKFAQFFLLSYIINDSTNSHFIDWISVFLPDSSLLTSQFY